MAATHFKELLVWQKSMELTLLIYDISDKFPQREIYGLTSQMRRSAVSIPSNIAEGQERNHPKEFIQFLGMASGSIAELETQLIIAFRRNYVAEGEYEKCASLISEVGKMLNGLIRSISKNMLDS